MAMTVEQLVECMNGKGKRGPVPFSPPQNPHDLIWARTLATAVGRRQLTA
jgi:hypothetical protein